MSTVVYLPPKQENKMGEGIGQAVSQVMQQQAERQQQQKQQELLSSFMQGIDNAPDRQSALEIMAKAGPRVLKDPAHFNMVYRHIDEKHPAGDTTPVEAKAYSQRTGAEQSFWAPKSELASNDPAMLDKHLGAGASREWSTTKPAKVLEYVDPNGRDVGARVPGMTQDLPPGSMSKDEWQRKQAERTQQRADTTEQLRIKADARAERASARADNRASKDNSEAQDARREKMISQEQDKVHRLAAQEKTAVDKDPTQVDINAGQAKKNAIDSAADLA